MFDNDRFLPPFRTPAQFASRPGLKFPPKVRLPTAPSRITQPYPGEVEQFMDEDAPPFVWIAAQLRVHDNEPLAEESCRMHLLSSAGYKCSPPDEQGGAVGNSDRRPRQGRECDAN